MQQTKVYSVHAHAQRQKGVEVSLFLEKEESEIEMTNLFSVQPSRWLN